MKTTNINPPSFEIKSKEHYDFISKQFNGIYIKLDDFIKRDDLFIVAIRKNDVLVAVSLFKKSSTQECIKYKYPKRILLYNDKNDKNDNIKIYMKNYYMKKFDVIRIIFTVVNETCRGLGLNQFILDFIFNYSIKIGNIRYNVANIREPNKQSLKSFLKNGYTISKRLQKNYKCGDKKIRVTKYLKSND